VGGLKLICILKMIMCMEPYLFPWQLQGHSVLAEEVSNCRLDRNALSFD